MNKKLDEWSEQLATVVAGLYEFPLQKTQQKAIREQLRDIGIQMHKCKNAKSTQLKRGEIYEPDRL